MKKVVTKLPAGEILRISRLDDGTFEVVQRIPDEEKLKPKEVGSSSKTVIPAKLVTLVEAEKLSKTDKFLTYTPKTTREKETKALILEAIEKGVKNFYCHTLDPSFTKAGEGIFFSPGHTPAVGRSYPWWEKVAKEYAPERKSRLGTRLEYGAFLGVYIKNLVSKGKGIKWAWNAVCNDSRELGHYWDSDTYGDGFKGQRVVTGSKCNFGFGDLANTSKILADDTNENILWIASGNFLNDGCDDPIARLSKFMINDYEYTFSVGWIVFS